MATGKLKSPFWVSRAGKIYRPRDSYNALLRRRSLHLQPRRSFLGSLGTPRTCATRKGPFAQAAIRGQVSLCVKADIRSVGFAPGDTLLASRRRSQ